MPNTELQTPTPRRKHRSDNLNEHAFPCLHRQPSQTQSISKSKRRDKAKVEMWRGGVGLVYLFPALLFAGASLTRPCSVSTSRLSNRTGAIRASGPRRKHHAFAHGKSAVRRESSIKPYPA